MKVKVHEDIIKLTQGEHQVEIIVKSTSNKVIGEIYDLIAKNIDRDHGISCKPYDLESIKP